MLLGLSPSLFASLQLSSCNKEVDLTTNLGKLKKQLYSMQASVEKSENFTYNDKLCQKFLFLTQFLNKFQNRMEIKNLKIMLNKRIALFAKLIKY